MKKALNHLTAGCIILSVLVFSVYPAFALEPKGLLPQIEILTTGMSRSATKITQNNNFPLDFNHFLILAIGYGKFSITVSKADTAGDFLVLTGWATSSAGTVPFLKFGITGATLNEVIEIGNERSPLGLVWFVSWVYSPVVDPSHNYNYDLSFSFYN
jgi:hypothetical protein